LLVVELVFLGTVGASVVSALTAPGTQSSTARVAEWARNNGMSLLVTWAEQLTYQPPKVVVPRRRTHRCTTEAHHRDSLTSWIADANVLSGRGCPTVSAE